VAHIAAVVRRGVIDDFDRDFKRDLYASTEGSNGGLRSTLRANHLAACYSFGSRERRASAEELAPVEISNDIALAMRRAACERFSGSDGSDLRTA